MPAKPYVVVTGSDFSEHAVRALEAAYEQARRHAPAEVHVVHASLMASVDASVESAARLGLTAAPVSSLDEQRQQLARHLDRQLPLLEGFPDAGVKVYGHVILDAPSLALVSLASVLQASLIVIGSHGLHGFARWILGSVADGVVRQAECPVLVVPPLPRQLQPPRIEPPCPRCTETRATTHGQDLWCLQHQERHGRRHTYYQADRIGADGSLPLVLR
jgi:nucleotide-binding universal stress UspA family protein